MHHFNQSCLLQEIMWQDLHVNSKNFLLLEGIFPYILCICKLHSWKWEWMWLLIIIFSNISSMWAILTGFSVLCIDCKCFQMLKIIILNFLIICDLYPWMCIFSVSSYKCLIEYTVAGKKKLNLWIYQHFCINFHWTTVDKQPHLSRLCWSIYVNSGQRLWPDLGKSKGSQIHFPACIHSCISSITAHIMFCVCLCFQGGLALRFKC